MTLSNAPLPGVLTDDRDRLPAPEAGARRRWLDPLSRFGFVIRGIIYFVPGVFALSWALGRNPHPMSQASAIDVIGHQPMGRVLLVVVAVGLAGYAAWGIVRAIADPLRRGHSAGGIVLRIGYAFSAIAYLALLVATLRLLTGGLPRAEPQMDWTVGLLAHPYGAVLVVAIGLCWILGSGLTQIVMGWRHSFDRDLALDSMGPVERRWAVGLGRVGLVARGIVFTLIGVLVVAAALHHRVQPDSGLEGALKEIARQPFGRALLAAAGAGLMTFGLFSAMCARWMRMSRSGGERHSTTPQPLSTGAPRP